MRIILTADTVGGVWDHAAALAGALRGRGHDVLLAVFGESSPRREESLPAGVEVETRPYRLEWMSRSAADTRESAAWVAGLASRWRADVVQTHQYSCALARFEAPVVVVSHSDVVSWFAEVQGRAAPAEWSHYADLVGAGLRAADVVVAPTGYQSRLLRRHYGRGADLVIHNGIAPPATPAAPTKATVIVCAARAWDDAKGVRILDEAAGRPEARDLEIHLLGETTSPEGAVFHPRALTAHGAQGRAEVDRWMRRASIYVAPSLYEPFGLAPLEAAFHGCALVLSDIGSFRELWDGCAEFFPAGDAGALSAILSRLAADPSAAARLAGQARERADRRFTADAMGDAYLSLYTGCRARRGVRAIDRTPSSIIQPA